MSVFNIPKELDKQFTKLVSRTFVAFNTLTEDHCAPESAVTTLCCCNRSALFEENCPKCPFDQIFAQQKQTYMDH